MFPLHDSSILKIIYSLLKVVFIYKDLERNLSWYLQFLSCNKYIEIYIHRYIVSLRL